MARRILIVIDVQTDFFEGKEPLPDPERVLTVFKKVVGKARQATSAVKLIWVRHGEQDENDPLYTNSRGWQIAAQLDPPKSVDTDEPIVEKSQPNSFSNPRLGELVEAEITKHEANGVELYFMGLQSDICIQATTKAALQRYETDPAVKKIILVKDAHATYAAGGKSDLEISESINDALASLGSELMSSDEVFN